MTRDTDADRAGEIAERVRRYRRERGWTQAQLAERAALGCGTVSRIERGLERPLGRTAKALGQALGVELERLLGLDGQPALFPLPEELRMDLVRRIASLPDSDVERVHAGLRRLLDGVAAGVRRPRRDKGPT
jgi:transcriptional regulator with XRE-family HTH domain